MDLVFQAIKNKLVLVVLSPIIALVPLYSYRMLIITYRKVETEYENAVSFHRRHNCVVMYNQKRGMSGWPPYLKRIKLDLKMEKCLDVFHEPILYFINTANKSLDIAIMLISVNSFYTALVEAHKRGVKIRILLNFEHCDSRLADIRRLAKEGIPILTYISQKSGSGSIMHYKFMVKDYSESDGYIFTGSLNLSESGFLNNFEDVVFTSSEHVVHSFHKNFVDCWNYVQNDNENLYNKTILLDANLI